MPAVLIFTVRPDPSHFVSRRILYCRLVTKENRSFLRLSLVHRLDGTRLTAIPGWFSKQSGESWEPAWESAHRSVNRRLTSAITSYRDRKGTKNYRRYCYWDLRCACSDSLACHRNRFRMINNR